MSSVLHSVCDDDYRTLVACAGQFGPTNGLGRRVSGFRVLRPAENYAVEADPSRPSTQTARNQNPKAQTAYPKS